MSSRPLSARIGLVLLIAGIVACVRFYYLSRYGVGMPYWDQWDAEGARLLKPWIEGTLCLRDLVAAHNEHRILPSRLMTLALYQATGAWSNLTEAKASAFVFATVIACLAWLGTTGIAVRARWFVASVVLVLGVLPFGWENLLVGFQSQFYFSLLFAICAIALAARDSGSILAYGCIVLLAVLACLTMASGLLTALTLAAICAVNALRGPSARPQPLLAAGALLAIAVVAYVTLPVVPGHAAMRAQGPRDFLHALTHALGWPADSFHWTGVWLLAPSAAYTVHLLRRGDIARIDVAMLGLCLWSVAQAAAIAYGRGHGLMDLSSRYADLLLPGLVANAWFCTRLFWRAGSERTWRLAAAFLTAMYVGVLAFGLIDRTPADWAAMRARAAAAEVQQANVMRYLTTGNPDALDRGFFELPYPDHGRLRTLLDDPAIRHALDVRTTSDARPDATSEVNR